MGPDPVTIFCGIFDDFDVAPTLVVMVIEPDEEFFITDAWELRAEAERLYGRPAPDHALFWTAAT